MRVLENAMTEIATLKLQESHRQGGGGKTERSYFDFYVSGTRLLNLLGWENADYITPLGWGKVELQTQAVAELLRKSQPSLPTGRCQIYVCPECGDIGCGAITVCVEREGEFIVWRDFGFENNDEENMPRLSDFENVSPLHFEATAYWQALSSFKPQR